MSSWAKRKRSRSLRSWAKRTEQTKEQRDAGISHKILLFCFNVTFLEKTTVILYRSRCFASPCGFDCENITPWCFLRSGWHIEMRNSELWLIFAEQNFLFGRIISSPTEMHVFIVGVDALGDPFTSNPIKITVERIILIYKTFPIGKFLVLPFFKKVAKNS